MSEQVAEHIKQLQEPIQKVRPPKKKRDIRGFINSPYLFLVVPLIVGGIFLVLNPQYVTLAMNYPFSVAFILAIPVAFFLVKLVLNFFSVIEKWIRLQFEKARNAKRGQFLEFVIAVFMFVSINEAGPLFNKIQGNGLGGALGYITVLGFDLIAVVCMRSRAKMLRKGHDGKARIYQMGVWLCALVSVFANLYEAIENAVSLSAKNPLTFLAPLTGVAFPVMIIFLSYATDADEDDVDDPEIYRKEQEKRVSFIQAKREIAQAILDEKIKIDLLKGREIFLKGWFFTRKKVNAVIEVCTEQVLAKVQSQLVEVKNAFVSETLKETKASYKLQIEKLETQITELKAQNQRLLHLQSEGELKLQDHLKTIEAVVTPIIAEQIRRLQVEVTGSQSRQFEALQSEMQKMKVEQKLLQNLVLQSPASAPPANGQQKKNTSSDRQPIELEAKRSSRFNKTQFVLDCLKENPEMPSSEMKERAEKLQQSLSDQIISMARSDFKNQQKLKAGESGSHGSDTLPETGEFEKVEMTH